LQHQEVHEIINKEELEAAIKKEVKTKKDFWKSNKIV
jgi:hypothetical protein